MEHALVRHNGDRDELIVVHASQVTAYDPPTGKELWTCKGLPEQAFASPAIGDGVLVATGHRVKGGGTRITAVRLSPNMSGDVTETHRLWQADMPKDCVGSGVIAAGHVFLPTQFGSVACYDLKTGKRRWDKRSKAPATRTAPGPPSSSPATASTSPTTPAKPSSSAPPQVRSAGNQHGGRRDHLRSLAVSDGEIYLRTYDALWCLGHTGPIAPHELPCRVPCSHSPPCGLLWQLTSWRGWACPSCVRTTDMPTPPDRIDHRNRAVWPAVWHGAHGTRRTIRPSTLDSLSRVRRRPARPCGGVAFPRCVGRVAAAALASFATALASFCRSFSRSFSVVERVVRLPLALREPRRRSA